MAGAVGAGALIAPGAAQAVNFPVTNTNDSGVGSLRQAIIDSNTAGTDDVITFQPGVTGEIQLTTGQLLITDDVTITGPGAGVLAISGDANGNNTHDAADSRILDVSSPASTPPYRQVSISGLTFREGTANPNPYAEAGGAIRASGTHLTLDAVTFTNNQASDRGGAVAAFNGPVDMTDSTVSNNRAFRYAGGLTFNSYDPYDEDSINVSDTTITGNRAGDPAPSSPYGYPAAGGLSVRGSAQLENLTITDNVASETFGTNPPTGFGGGFVLRDNGGIPEVANSTITGNSAGSGGGGGFSSGGVIADSTISDNDVDPGRGYGGGLYFEGGKVIGSTISGNGAGSGGGLYVAGSSDTILRASTITGNQATGSGGPTRGLGGGVMVFTDRKYGPSPGELKARGTTIAANSASVAGGNLFAYYEDPLDDPFVQLRGTIVAGGTAPGASGDIAQRRPGSIAAGFSLIEDPGGTALAGDPDGTNILGADPKLGALADNGGPTQTMALAPTSPAIDSSQAFGMTTDQRGQARTVGSAADNAPLSDGTDIGAFEVQQRNAPGDDDVTKPKVKVKAPKKLKLKGGDDTATAKVKVKAKDDRTKKKRLKLECKVDKGRWEKCKPKVKVELDAGKHIFKARATDQAGNTGKGKAKIKVG